MYYFIIIIKTNVWKSIDFFIKTLYNLLRNKEKAECGCHLHKEMEVVRMIEIEMLLIIKLLFAGLVSVTIIAFALIIAIALILSK